MKTIDDRALTRPRTYTAELTPSQAAPAGASVSLHADRRLRGR